MAGLPPGWEWDYDGQRWFYKYKPTGLIQYHFPSEGDEFPAFIEAGAPAPDLAPEERLESQQQIKRQTSSAGSSAGARSKRAQMPARSNQYAMSATAKPISVIWEGDDDAEADGVFQPENFMFLGLGTYADVSPLGEEEEEAAKRSVVGAIGERVEGGRTAETTAAASAKGVSPLGSSKKTPMMAKSEPSRSPAPVDASIKEGLAIESGPVMQGAHKIESAPISSQSTADVEDTAILAPVPESSVVHMLDSREMPVEVMGDTVHWFDPVGSVAEMPTEHTGAAYVELYPDPVEIADNTVLAPIETAAAAVSATAVAELSVKNSPVEGNDIPIVNAPKKPNGDQSVGGGSITREDGNDPTKHVPSCGHEGPRSEHATARLAQNARPQYADYGTRQGREQHGSHLEPHGQAQPSTPIKLETYKIARKQPGGTPGTPIAKQSQQPAYQAYVPTTNAHLSQAENRHSIGLLREASLMMNMKRNSSSIKPDSIPHALAPPQHPVPNGSSQLRSTEITKPITGENTTDNIDLSLAHAPSVLKPARNRNSVQDAPPQQQQIPTTRVVTIPPAQPQPEPQRFKGISKFPSVLRPARGKPLSQPGQMIKGPVGQLDEPQSAHKLNQRPVVSQDPLQLRSRLYQVTNSHPTGSNRHLVTQPPAWATANAGQQARPVSSMPSMNHVPYGSQYSSAGPGLIPHGHQPTQPSLLGCQPPDLRSQPSPLQRMQQAVASQPPRPQTVVGTIPPVSSDTNKADSIVQPQQRASLPHVRPLQQIQGVVTEQLDRPRNVPAVVQPLLNVLPLQQESTDSQFRIQPVQQARNAEALLQGQSQPQPQLQCRPSESQPQLKPTQPGHHGAGEQPTLPQNSQTAANVSSVVNTPSPPNQQESERKLTPSIFDVQPLQQVQNAEAGQPSQLQSALASVGVAQHAGGHSASVQQELHITSQFQVQPLQDIQNASAGQPIKSQGVREASQSSQAIAGQSISAQEQRQLQQSSTYLFQVAEPNRTQDAAAGQLPRPHSVIGTIQHSPPPKPPKTAFAPDPSQPDSSEPTHPSMRRASMFIPDEVPSARPREDSQVSALGSPLPTNSARRDSSNPTIDDSNYTPSPLTDTTGPLSQNGWTQSMALSQQKRNPPLPSKIREHAEGSFFPIQNTTDVPASQDRLPTKNILKQQQQQQQDSTSQPQTKSHPAQHAEHQQPPQLTQSTEQQGEEMRLPQEPTQDSEHPIGYQVSSFTSQSSHSPAGQHTVTVPGSGHTLGPIEEHDENEQTPQITRPSSMASSTQHSIPFASESPHEPTLQQPKPSAPTQIQRPVQTIGQSPMPSASLGQPLIGQSASIQQPQDVIPPGHMYAGMQTQIVPGKMVSNLNPWHPQGQWNLPVNYNRLTQGSQEKERKWSKWFKGGNTKLQPAPQQVMPPQPATISGPGPQQWTGGPYSPSHFWQQPGQQKPFSHGQSPSMSDTASISTIGSDKKSQQHNQHVSPGQVAVAIQADPTGQLGTGQAMQGQATHQQTLSGQMMLQGQHPSQMPPQKHPMPLPLGQSAVHQLPPGQLASSQMYPNHQLPGQMPAGRGYIGQAHPLQMAANPPLPPGFTASQPHLQQQGRMQKASEGPSDPNQPHMGHSKLPSTASQAGVPQQGVTPQQVYTPGSYQVQQATEHNMMPPPLFAPSHGNRPENGKIQPHPMSQPANNKWTQGPAADYSGGDWGDEEDWGRR